MLVPRLRYPIVFVHGLFGFSRLRLGPVTVRCFAGVVDTLREAGNHVLEADLSPTAGVAERAAQLKDFLLRATEMPVHIIAHSMGGLDTRYLITRLDMADRVASLTSVGTPHRGSAFADWSLRHLERYVRPVLERFAIPHQAFFDLSTARCAEFNAAVPDSPDVRYFSVAGRFTSDWLAPEWLLTERIVAAVEGPNDGVVSVASATYGEHCDVWEGDHLSLVNWRNPVAEARGRCRERTPEYLAIVRRLLAVERGDAVIRE